MSPTSRASHFASTSDETHQLVSFTTIPDQPPDPSDHVSPQLDMAEPSTAKRWKRNILSISKELWKQHKRPKPLGKAPGVRESVIAVIKTSRLNALLIFMPLSWIFRYIRLSNTLVFVFSFLAVIPLAKLLDFATDDLSLRLGWTLAELLNTTSGNAVDFIVAIIALVKCQLTVVRLFLVGSILRNLLLVLGTCFYVGGTRFSEQGYGLTAVKLDTSLLTLGVIAVLLPAAFHRAVQPQATDGVGPLTKQQEGHDILLISHGISIILLFIYLCYIVFQLFSNVYDDCNPDIQRSVAYPPNVAKQLHTRTSIEQKIPPASSSPPPTVGVVDPDELDARTLEAGSEEEEIDKPEMGRLTAIILLIVVAVLVSITAGFLVDSIDGLTLSHRISKWFIGLILLPNIGNAADHTFVILRSAKRSSKVSLGAPVVSSIQIAVFIFPLLVIVGWILGKLLTLLFDPFESMVLFLSVLTVNKVLQDAKSNWLKGMILICLYVIIAVIFWYYPVSDPASLLSSCK